MAKIERKAVGTVKQLEAHGFEQVGAAYQGTFVGLKQTTITDKDGTREATIIQLQPDEGDKFGVWANPILVELIGEIQVGQYVEIKHTGVGPAKGKKSGAKLFVITRFE
jgi:hypothetical protein